MDDTTATSLRTVVDYLWDDEERNFEEDPQAVHIFNDLVLLRAFLDNRREDEKCAACGERMYVLVRGHHHTENGVDVTK